MTQLGENVADHCFASLMNSLNQLYCQDLKFAKTPQAQAAFDLAMERLTSPRVIHYADFSQLFIVLTDTSNVVITAIILRKMTNEKCIIPAESKASDSTQQKSSTTQREAHAII